jgi:hypothetical protein
MATEKQQKYKLPGVSQIPPELIQAGDKALSPEICKLIKFMLVSCLNTTQHHKPEPQLETV